LTLVSAPAHRALDYTIVVVFALAPTVLGLTGVPSWLAWGLAVVHLLLTWATRFEAGGRGAVPFRVHGWVELVVGLALAAFPWVTEWPQTARMFYGVAGGVILLIWLLTRYEPLHAA
jgi:hypothetical protein